MVLLIVFVLVALVFSFLCSIAEAMLLSVRSAYVGLLEQEGHRAGKILRGLQAEINRPLAAILRRSLSSASKVSSRAKPIRRKRGTR